MLKRKQYDNKIILPRTEEHELPKGGQGLLLCKECNAAYYKKSWHRNLRNFKNLREDLPVKFSLCPACKMIRNKQFEGEIVISGVPADVEDNLIHLVELFGRRAEQKDNQHRIISIQKNRAELVITTTENQLAVKIAKKIRDTFKKVNIKTSYSPRPSDAAYIKLEFRK